jgi:hypothetical protein
MQDTSKPTRMFFGHYGNFLYSIQILNAASYFIRLPSVGGHRVEVTRMMCGRCTIIHTELDQKTGDTCKGSRLNEMIGWVSGSNSVTMHRGRPNFETLQTYSFKRGDWIGIFSIIWWEYLLRTLKCLAGATRMHYMYGPICTCNDIKSFVPPEQNNTRILLLRPCWDSCFGDYNSSSH